MKEENDLINIYFWNAVQRLKAIEEMDALLEKEFS